MKKAIVLFTSSLLAVGIGGAATGNEIGSWLQGIVYCDQPVEACIEDDLFKVSLICPEEAPSFAGVSTRVSQTTLALSIAYIPEEIILCGIQFDSAAVDKLETKCRTSYGDVGVEVDFEEEASAECVD